MWAFFIMIVFGIFCFLSIVFPPVLSFLTFYGFLFLSFVLAVSCFILFIIMLYSKKKYIWYLITVFVFVSYLLFLLPRYSYLRGRYLVSKHLKNDYKVSGKVMGVKAKDYDFNDYNSCDYVFNVKLNDGENVVFQSGYCDVGTMWTSYDVIDNYSHHYIPHFYDIYKKSHNVNFKLDTRKDDFSWDNDVIKYNGDDLKDVCDFIYYLDEHMKSDYSIEVVNGDHDYNSFIYYSRDKDYGECKYLGD